MFHDQIDAREQIDVPQDVAFHSDDVSKLSFANRVKVFIDLHLHRRPKPLCWIHWAPRKSGVKVDRRFAPLGTVEAVRRLNA